MGAEGNTFETRFQIAKLDDEKRRLFGFALTATDADGNEVVDHQGDVISESDLEEAAYDYFVNSRELGAMHEQSGLGHAICGIPLTKDIRKMINDNPGCKFLVGFQVTDQKAWELAKSGERSELSIEGSGIRTPITEAA